MTEATVLGGTIGESAFENCKILSDLIIGDGVTSIGPWAFDYCDALTSVYISDLSAWCRIDFMNTRSNPFYYGSKLYLNGDLLTELVIPEEVTEIKEYTFYGCSSIEKITIGDGVTSIGDYAFDDCYALISVTIPNSVTSIGDYAFDGCQGLTSVTIGDGLTSIGIRAFGFCLALTECYCYATTPPYNTQWAFDGIKDGATLYVPARCGLKYGSATGWRDFDNIIEMD